jgi:hypothetical protein
MANRENTIPLADRFELTDLEPDVDPEKAALFLAGDASNKPKVDRRRSGEGKSIAFPDSKGMVAPRSPPQRATKPSAGDAELWTSRTIRLRQSTATALTKAACGQKVKQAEGKLKTGEPVTVQEIADHAIRLALAELGYARG